MSLTDKLPPVSVRIKRKRTQDPLQGLIVDSSISSISKKSRTDSYVFKLAGTFDQSQDSSNDIVLNEDTAKAGDKRKRVFHIPKPNKAVKASKPPNGSSPVEINDIMALDDRKPESRTDDVVPDQINQMVQSYLQASDGLGDEYTPDHDVEDYVYDIYYREPFNSKKWDKISAKVGIIVLDSEDEDFFYRNDDSTSEIASDDEDSNAEDFYRNDYPDEEQEQDEDFARIGTCGDRKDTVDIQEGLDYMGIDDDALGLHDADEFEENWSEDENFEQYRDRIMGDIEDKISRNKTEEM